MDEQVYEVLVSTINLKMKLVQLSYHNLLSTYTTSTPAPELLALFTSLEKLTLKMKAGRLHKVA